MKVLKRFIIIRDIDGNDKPFEYEVNRYESINECIKFFGEDTLLNFLHDATEKRERDMKRAEALHEMRQRMKNK